MLGGGSVLSLISHVMVGVAWAVALWKIWEARSAPMAHQAFAAACAIVLGEFVLIFQQHISVDTMTFFLAIAQLVMAISVVKLFNWAARLVEANDEMHSRACELQLAPHEAKSLLTIYGGSIAVAILAGVLYMVLTLFESMHV